MYINENTYGYLTIKYDSLILESPSVTNIPEKYNAFFDEINSIDHKIDVPQEYMSYLKEHTCQCGKLIISSFLPYELHKLYTAYIHQKNMNELEISLSKQLSASVDNAIMNILLDSNS